MKRYKEKILSVFLSCLLLLLFFPGMIYAESLFSDMANIKVNPQPGIVIKKVNVNGITLAYYIRGQGQPLLMINGYTGTLSMWDPALLEDLQKNYQLIIFDNRGVGFSTDTKANNTSMSQMADDAAALVKTLGYHQVAVLGWSMGARIAQQVAIRHPEIVTKLILCAPNPGGQNAAKTPLNTETELSSPTVSSQQKLLMVFGSDSQGMAAAEAFTERLKQALENGSIPNDMSVSDETMARQKRARTELWGNDNSNYNDLPSIKVPTLVVDGRNDIIDLPANVSIIANRIPYAWAVYLNGGHGFLFQYHKQFAELVRVFLQ